MQIGNNSSNGPRPNNQKPSHLDPDLTKANRDGIDETTSVASENTRESIRDRSPAKALESRKPALDSFQRAKPNEDTGVDVSERIRNARAQAGQKRVENARSQANAKRVENARDQSPKQTDNQVSSSDSSGDKSQRIANARAQRSDDQGQRISNARKGANGAEDVKSDGDNGKRIANARGQHSENQGQRISNARKGANGAADVKSDGGDNGKRISNARTQNNEARQAQRIENARTQYLENSKGGSDGSLVAASAVSLPAIGGSHETAPARAERVAVLREAHQAGALNTPERAQEAAGRLLGGE
ncbi:MAG: hypothetical protein ACI9F9_001284 [Candidatus Paceibacteria bacterium]|jgi:hypothetical protein